MLTLKKPLYTQYEMCRPIYYEDKNGKEFIIITPNYETGTTIIKYDIDKDDYIDDAKYPENIKVEYHCSIVRDHILTILSANKEAGSYNADNDKNIISQIALNLHTTGTPSQWDIKQQDTGSIHWSFKQILEISNGDLHAHNMSGDHYILKHDETQWNLLYNDSEYHANRWMLYNEITQRIYLMNARQIMEYYPISLSDEYKPIKSKIRYPKALTPLSNDSIHYGVLSPGRAEFVFGDRILMLLHTEREEMWFLDMTEEFQDDTQWIKKEFYENVIEHKWQSLFIVVTKYNFVHFINTYPEETCCHYKVSLYQLLPDVLLLKYMKPLVSGFIRNNAINLDIPHELTIMILRFC